MLSPELGEGQKIDSPNSVFETVLSETVLGLFLSLVNQFLATPRCQLHWTGPIANNSDVNLAAGVVEAN